MLLKDVAIIRPLAILSIVFYHSFCIYDGRWKAPVGFVNVNFYKFLVFLSYSFMLEAFVFMSGYLFAFQTLTLKRPNNFISLIWNKFKRLIIPSIFFGLLYYIIFFYSKGSFGFISFFVQILSGVDHLWFLPMLFWCFIFEYIILKIKLNKFVLLVLLAGLSAFSLNTRIQFGISISLQYLFYFHLGYIILLNKDEIINKYANMKVIFIVVLLLLISLIVHHFLSVHMIKDQNIITFAIIVTRLIRIFNAVMFVFMLYLTSNYFTIKKNIKLSSYILRANSICFGIYIYHHFILQILYYKTSLPGSTNPYALPWIGLFITLVLSIELSVLTRKVRFGRFLIG